MVSSAGKLWESVGTDPMLAPLLNFRGTAGGQAGFKCVCPCTLLGGGGPRAVFQDPDCTLLSVDDTI